MEKPKALLGRQLHRGYRPGRQLQGMRKALAGLKFFRLAAYEFAVKGAELRCRQHRKNFFLKHARPALIQYRFFL